MTSPVSAIEAIEKAMEGVTPGPWKAEGYVVMGDWHASGGIASVRSGSRAFNDAAFIAACNPVAIREVLSLARQAEALQREMAELREALEPFAAEADGWSSAYPDTCLARTSKVNLADLRRARALLGGSENAGN